MEIETKNIVGFNGLYEASSDGKISRIGQIINRKNGTKVFIPGGERKGKINKCGYHEVNLTTANKASTRYVHRLIAQTFIPNPDNKPCVNHINGIKTDNRVENLEWVTKSENTIHAWANGLNWSHKGENHQSSKLTNEQVLEIRNKYTPFEYTYPMLSKEYGVSHHTIRDIVRRESWKHI